MLPAGTYVFKILDSQSDRHIVHIFNKDETTVYATILAIPNYRLKSTDKTVITFRERPAGEPEALRAWFYPGRNWGDEFVYPKAKAMELAKAANTPVLFTPVEIPVEVAEPIRHEDIPVTVGLVIDHFFPRQLNEVVAICERIARDIRHQYTLGYVSSNAAQSGVYRVIRVVARAPGNRKLFVRTRSGYIAGGESPPVKDRGAE